MQFKETVFTCENHTKQSLPVRIIPNSLYLWESYQTVFTCENHTKHIPTIMQSFKWWTSWYIWLSQCSKQLRTNYSTNSTEQNYSSHTKSLTSQNKKRVPSNTMVGYITAFTISYRLCRRSREQQKSYTEL